MEAKVRGDRFRLFAQGPRFVRNAYAPFLYGRVEAALGGTRIVGRFRMHPLVRVFNFIWYGGLVIMGFLFPVLALSQEFPAGEPPFWIIIGPWLMILVGLGFEAFGRRIARGQVVRLHQFLRTDLEAAPEDNCLLRPQAR